MRSFLLSGIALFGVSAAYAGGVTQATCEGPYSYYGGYSLTLAQQADGSYELSYERHRGPDGDGEEVPLRTVTAKLESETGAEETFGFDEGRLLLSLTSESAVLTLPTTTEELYCKLQ